MSPEQDAQSSQALTIRFPQRDEVDVAQDHEWCEVGTAATRVRFHDYARVFGIPGLYDALFGGPASATRCVSPQVMAGLLEAHLHHRVRGRPAPADAAPTAAGLRVLDFGAGNGMLGGEVRRRLCGARPDRGPAAATTLLLVGLDILPEARLAAERDRPGVYDAYVVADITEDADSLRAAGQDVLLAGFDVLVSASALSFGDASAAAFKAAISLVEDGGLVLFNIKAGLLDNKESGSGGAESGFSNLFHQAVEEGTMEILEQKTYCHRFSVTGKPLLYVAVAAIKHGGRGLF